MSDVQNSPENAPTSDDKRPTDSPLETAASGVDNSSRDEVATPKVSREIGGRKGLDPTRYGDWEKGGRCIDF